MPRKPLTRARLLRWIALLAVALACCLALAVSRGHVSLGHALFGGQLDVVERSILFDVRLPRVLLAGLLGGALTVAGVVFQALLRNPLADPEGLVAPVKGTGC